MARYRLGSICQIISGSTPKTGVQEYWNGDKKWITPAELSESDYIIYDTERKLTDAGVKSAGLTPLPKGTVILSSRAPIGKVAIAGCEMYCNQGFKNLVCSDVINNRYLYWYLRSKTDYLNSLGRGATFKEISKSTVADIEMNVPELSTQVERVAHLEKLQTIIAHRNTQLAKLDELVKCKFVELFGRLSITSHPTTTLRDVATIKHGYAFKGEFFSKDSNGIVLVTPGNFKVGGGFQEHECRYFTGDYPDEFVLEAGSLIVTMTDLSKNADTLGYAALIPEHSKRVYLHNQRIGKISLKPCMNKYFVCHYMQTEEYRLKIVSTATGSTVHHTSPTRILDSVIMLPPLSLQNEFEDFVHRIDKLRFAARRGQKSAFSLWVRRFEIDRGEEIW